MIRKSGLVKPAVLCTWTSCTPNAASMARGALRRALGQWGLSGDLVSDIVLAVSEGVANSIEHTVGPYELRLRCAAAEVICEVQDGDPRVPQIPDFAAVPAAGLEGAHRGGGLDALCALLSERGRGLRLVHELTNGAWGFRPGKRSKVLWLAWPLPHLAAAACCPSLPTAARGPATSAGKSVQSRGALPQLERKRPTADHMEEVRLMDTSPQPKQTPEDLHKAAAKSTEELRAGLASHGIKLPLLRLDPMTNTAGFPCPLVSLGSCNLETARKLTAALRASPAAETEG